MGCFHPKGVKEICQDLPITEQAGKWQLKERKARFQMERVGLAAFNAVTCT